MNLLARILAQIRALLGGKDKPRPSPWTDSHQFKSDPRFPMDDHDVCVHCGCSRNAARLGLKCWGGS